jgi:hypothetical protein
VRREVRVHGRHLAGDLRPALSDVQRFELQVDDQRPDARDIGGRRGERGGGGRERESARAQKARFLIDMIAYS